MEATAETCADVAGSRRVRIGRKSLLEKGLPVELCLPTADFIREVQDGASGGNYHTSHDVDELPG